VRRRRDASRQAFGPDIRPSTSDGEWLQRATTRTSLVHGSHSRPDSTRRNGRVGRGPQPELLRAGAHGPVNGGSVGCRCGGRPAAATPLARRQRRLGLARLTGCHLDTTAPSTGNHRSDRRREPGKKRIRGHRASAWDVREERRAWRQPQSTNRVEAISNFELSTADAVGQRPARADNAGRRAVPPQRSASCCTNKQRSRTPC
jgi:hypothetical protein